MSKSYGQADPRLASYVERVFRLEHELFAEIETRADAAGLPRIQVSLFEGRHLELLTRAIGARRAVEIGTLAGYSGLSILRGLTPDGTLDSFELDARHAAVARATFDRNGFGARARIHVGPAASGLAAIEDRGPFDLVFIDADKKGYPFYLDWAARHLRSGGVVLLDNAFAWRQVLDVVAGEPADAGARAIHAANELLARGRPFLATMWPTQEGLAMGVKTS